MNFIIFFLFLLPLITAHNIMILLPQYISDYNDTIITTCDYECITNIFWNSQYNINDALRDNSNNNMYIDFDKSIILTVNTGLNYKSICDISTTQNTVFNKIRNNYNLQDYYFITFILPDVIFCGWDGVGYLTSPKISLIKNYIPRVILHELGHNLGLIHSSTLTDEYGDDSDPMGQYNTIQRFSTYSRYKLGWINNNYVKNITNSKGVLAVNILSSSIKTNDYNNIVLYTFRNNTNDIFISFRNINETTYDNLLNPIYNNKILIHSVGRIRNIFLKSLTIGEHITIGRYRIYFEKYNNTRAKILINIKL